jgi:hypothetical protein
VAADPEADEPGYGSSATVTVHSQTTLRVFQRALLPGPNGTLVEADTLVPIYEYWSVGARGIATPWSEQPAAMEVSGWFDATPGDRRNEHPFSGDVSAAWVRQPLGSLAITLGRQATFGGAARYARFDGAALSLGIPVGSSLQTGAVGAYAGYSVLPRWDARPGYFHLGSATDGLMRSSDALPEAERSGNLLFGARAQVAYQSVAFATATFHEQHAAGELERRDLGLDVRLVPDPALALNADLVLDTDGQALTDASAWLVLEPHPDWLSTLSYLHTNPRLFLSRQSVLSVFDTESFDELGIELSHVPLRQLSTAARGYIEWFADDQVGTRAELQVRADIDRARTTLAGVTYTRVLLPGGGYHSLRQSLRRRILVPLTGVAEAYFYWYDRAIAERRSSSVYAANLEWAWSNTLRLLWGASLAQTPYAASDLQSLVRLSYDRAFDVGGRR